MKNLIVNADDFGLTPGVTDGIIKSHLDGIVTSTSALLNSPHIQNDLPRIRRECPGLGIGVHMVITEGKPLMHLSQAASLVNENGYFHELHHHPDRINTLDLDEVFMEWKSQIETFFGFGFPPDHLDSHHHISYFSAGLFEVMLRLAAKYDLPIRFPPPEFIESLGIEKISDLLVNYGVRAPGACITSFYGDDNSVSQENILRIITAIKEGAYEVMCHPGYADQELIDGCSYSSPREQELGILTSMEVRQAVEIQGISLVNFSVFSKP